MRNQDNNNQTNDRWNVDTLTSFYNENKSVINGIGIAALAGAAVYSAVKWVPFKELYGKVEEKYNEQFADKQYAGNSSNEHTQY